ncbi:hypothetical protein MAPG_02287 [Magnaporthiopsis poae ATCC 64411]|uniref:asparaginase n=1 Tax=Magnaporthiopsis poae (strain ATCC 64411 / 73-15) TaxID=644358 RepID=A0A0C4DQY8_MAGP6|nr:hypothetical protein MAPG_02287 [Magnaporthiopsis poae ATCC 64411]
MLSQLLLFCLAQLNAVRDAASHNSSLRNIIIFATGGTIAGSAASKTHTTGYYQPGVLGVDELISAAPELYNVSNVWGVQVANVGSTSIAPELWLKLARLVQGAVVTHVTDTLEETVIFLDLTVRSAIAADGPINLLETVSLAAALPSRAGTAARWSQASGFFVDARTPEGLEVLADLAHEEGTRVVASTRTMGGFVRRDGAGSGYGAQDLNPQNARVMLQLALGVGYSSEQLAALFAFGPEGRGK